MIAPVREVIRHKLSVAQKAVFASPARFPGDRFCEYAASYAHGFQKQFPVFS